MDLFLWIWCYVDYMEGHVAEFSFSSWTQSQGERAELDQLWPSRLCLLPSVLLSLARLTSEGFHHCLIKLSFYESINGGLEPLWSHCISVAVFTTWKIILQSMRLGEAFLIQAIALIVSIPNWGKLRHIEHDKDTMQIQTNGCGIYLLTFCAPRSRKCDREYGIAVDLQLFFSFWLLASCGSMQL